MRKLLDIIGYLIIGVLAIVIGACFFVMLWPVWISLFMVWLYASFIESAK